MQFYYRIFFLFYYSWKIVFLFASLLVCLFCKFAGKSLVRLKSAFIHVALSTITDNKSKVIMSMAYKTLRNVIRPQWKPTCRKWNLDSKLHNIFCLWKLHLRYKTYKKFSRKIQGYFARIPVLVQVRYILDHILNFYIAISI